ncbi:MAG: sulfite exporter TauE/SafE family protein [Rhodospirillaceae bacterium]
MLLLVIATFLLAGFVKGVIGMGLPTVAVGVLGVVMAPTEAAALMVIPSLFTNIWQAFAGPFLKTALRRFGSLFIGICAGAWLFAWFGPAVDRDVATAALGAILVAYALVGRYGAQFEIPLPAQRWLSPCVGLATGALTAVTGVFVIPAVPYLQRLALGKDELVQALGLTFLVSTIALGLSLPATMMRVLSHYASAPAVALLAALAGMGMGQAVRRWISAAAFRACFFWGLLALGIHLTVRGLWH